MTILNAQQSTPLTNLLVCSKCRDNLEQQDQKLICVQCNHPFPIIDGIPKMIELTAGELDMDHPIEHRQKYEHRYQSPELAKGYNESFVKIPRDRKRTVRELTILEELLKSVDQCETILDIPCGGGRLSPPLAKACNHLIEMDASLEQVKLAVASDLHDTLRSGVSASALALPLPDNSVDGTLNARLSHHLPSVKERANLLGELLRVSRKFVIFSFTDRKSTSSFYRTLRGKPVNPAAMDEPELYAACQTLGAKVSRLMTVFHLGSRHRFALIIKD